MHSFYVMCSIGQVILWGINIPARNSKEAIATAKEGCWIPTAQFVAVSN